MTHQRNQFTFFRCPPSLSIFPKQIIGFAVLLKAKQSPLGSNTNLSYHEDLFYNCGVHDNCISGALEGGMVYPNLSSSVDSSTSATGTSTTSPLNKQA